MGVEVQSQSIGGGRCWTRMEPPHPLSLAPLDMTLPGDISAASFIVVAALIVPGSLVVCGGLASILPELGCWKP